jgi:hypothetical protein
MRHSGCCRITRNPEVIRSPEDRFRLADDPGINPKQARRHFGVEEPNGVSRSCNRGRYAGSSVMAQFANVCL